MLLNQQGANIQYPYHDLPLKSTHDRIGLWAMIGIYEELMEEITGDNEKDKEPTIILDCGGKREDEK